MSYLHAAVSMNPSAGVVRQMADEARAASALGLDWTVWLSRGSDLSPHLSRWPAPLRYTLLRVRFFFKLIRLAQNGRRIVLRYSSGDPFFFVASFFLGTYFTVHHTLEEGELAASNFPFARLQLMLERLLGRSVVRRAHGIVCLTPEIARHELRRVPARSSRPVFIYPNGIFYPEALDAPDERRDRPEVLFVASYFYEWHGLNALLDSIVESGEDGLLHVVGTLPAAARRKAEADPRVRIHGPLDPSRLEPLVAQCWLGLSSFGLSSNGMTEACTLKVRDYLRAGLPVYAGHRDSALPENFEYFREGPAQWRAILMYARAMRAVPRATIALAAQPLIDKKVLLERLHRSLEALTCDRRKWTRRT